MISRALQTPAYLVSIALFAICPLFSGTGLNAGECDDLLSETSCLAPESEWAFSARAIFLQRDTPDRSILAINTADNTQFVDSSGFDFDFETGYELDLRRMIGDDCQLQLRFFSIDSLLDSNTTATTNNNLLRFNAAIPVFATSGTGITSSFGSDLYNAEVGIGKSLNDWLHLSVGFRYLELNDSLEMSLTGAAVPATYSAQTRNRLYGAQLGGEALLWQCNKLSVELFGKGGVYGNNAAHDARLGTGAATVTATGSNDETAFIGELGINNSMRLTDCLSFYSGGQLLWIDRVAVGDRQLASTNFFSGSGYDGDGDVFFLGFSFGLKLEY
ncbi:MAG: hypothetical protein KDB00_22570 [Planctomycetales bacterium]|nr:hypothetical protein [Planctomycetales bacterium]